MKRDRISGWVIGLGSILLVGGALTAPAAAPAAPQSGIDQASTGQVTGKVFFKGEAPKLATIMMDQDPVCASEHGAPVRVEDGAVNSDGTLPNVFVYVKSGAEKDTFPTPAQPVVLDQRGCVYVPHVLGVMVGQPLKVISSDPTTHNVHVMSKVNRDWNQSQTPGAAPLIRKFSKAEIMIPVKCNQHPWMTAYIGVTSNPLYAVTGTDGVFTIKGVPPGTYTIGAWTATFGTREQTVTVSARGSETADFTFGAGQ
jgi:plastocyanin